MRSEGPSSPVASINVRCLEGLDLSTLENSRLMEERLANLKTDLLAKLRDGVIGTADGKFLKIMFEGCRN